MCKKAPNFIWSTIEPFPGATVWSWGTFGWSATIASVGPLQGLQVKSIALEHRLHCEGEGFFGGTELSQFAASERIFGGCGKYAIAWSCEEKW